MKKLYKYRYILLGLFVLSFLFENTIVAFANKKATGNPEIIQTTYKEDFQWKSSFALKGMYSTESLYFNIPEYWDYKYVYAEIQYNVSQLIDEVPASLTFSVNQIPVSSYKIQYQDGMVQTASVAIPTNILKEGFNVFDIVGYVRLYDEEGCADNNASANWINIDKCSFIRIGYETIDYNHQIANYPYPFLSSIDPKGEKTGIFVSDQMENSELAAAMYLMTDLGTETINENQLTLGTLGEWGSSQTERRIVIAKTKNLTPELSALIEDKSVLKDKALIKLGKDQQGKEVLLITSEDGDCLLEAVNLLMDEDRVSQEKSDIVYENKEDTKQNQGSESDNELTAMTYTLKELYGNGISYTGPFHQTKVINLPFTEDFTLAEGSKITLKYRFSENLDFNRSLVTVYWGNIPVASKKLKMEHASGDELSFRFPSDVIGVGGNTITIAFELELPDLFCTPRQEDMPWAYITEDSSFYLPQGSNNEISFDNKPIPFQNAGIFKDLMLVVPEFPTKEEINALSQVVAMYGNGVAPYGNLKVVRAGEFRKDDANYNVITVGTYDNDFIKQINDKLNFQYAVDGKRFESNEKLVLSDHYADDIAVLQLLPSPYAENRTILAICGTDNHSLSYVKEFIQTKENHWNLTNDCAIIDSELEVRTFEFLKDVVNDEKPTFTSFVSENKESIIFTIVSTSAMVMLLLAVIIILIRLKTYNRKGKNK